MGKVHLTYNHLFAIDQDIQKLQAESPALSTLLDGMIKRFYSNNKIEVQLMREKMHKIRFRHIEHNTKNEPVVIDVAGKKQWKFLSGTTQKAFEDEMNGFTSKPCQLII